MANVEYHEGPDALKRFEEGMTKLFNAPKDVKDKAIPKLKESVRKTQGKTSKG